MNLEKRINLLAELGDYCLSKDPAWMTAQHHAHAANGWFIPEFIGLAVRGIATQFLQKEKLVAWADKYRLPDQPLSPRTIGLTMAGNIPLVGFHDFLSIFISGHHQLIKPSGRDDILIRHLLRHLTTIEPAAARYFGFAERLAGCDAYIATGSNNSARYFEYYFAKYPHIIRRNRTSVALLTGEETIHDLADLAGDVYQYFGLGCRNVTQLYVPENYDFLPLLQAFRKYDYLSRLTKYKHNYDYQLTLLILNKRTYMSNESILLTDSDSPFSPISVLNYTYYRPGDPLPAILSGNHPDIQTIVGRAAFPSHNFPSHNFPSHNLPSHNLPSHNLTSHNLASHHFAGPFTPFGQAQQPGLEDYPDRIDTLKFLRDLP
jgi:hypothetical protein